jgi:hypothetical protein
MGAIENGKIKGLLPDKSLFAVNYPGYPSSLERAVETLGGQEAISKVYLENAFSSIYHGLFFYTKKSTLFMFCGGEGGLIGRILMEKVKKRVGQASIKWNSH